jgi:phosphatidylinositol 4-kinase type 2
MFARQIAVMKGQAWNVVETLKTPDHGPLELTRRAKVCVWDDLVEVPIAVPMRVTSSEMRRQSDFPKGIEEEMDIGAANSSSAPAVGDLPHPGRFELTGESAEDSQSPDEPPSATSPERKRASTDRPKLPRTSLGASYSGPPRSLNMYTPRHERRYSYATAATRRSSNSIAQHLYGNRASADCFYDDDVDGDLGYAAAEGMEGNQRKVIVERLEPVKSKNPVFTWC